MCEAIRQSEATGCYPHIDEPRAYYVPAPETRERGMTRPDRIDSIDLSLAFLPLATYAARWYSLITPPRILRRCTSVSSGMTADSS